MFGVIHWQQEQKGGDCQAFGHSRGGFTTKIHVRTDGQERPLSFILTGGEISDYKVVPDLIAMNDSNPCLMLADKGYDADHVRESLLLKGILPVIPPRSNRKYPQTYDRKAYKDRNRIERMFNQIKQSRWIASRYDKTKTVFMAFLNIAAIKLWVK